MIPEKIWCWVDHSYGAIILIIFIVEKQNERSTEAGSRLSRKPEK